MKDPSSIGAVLTLNGMVQSVPESGGGGGGTELAHVPLLNVMFLQQGTIHKIRDARGGRGLFDQESHSVTTYKGGGRDRGRYHKRYHAHSARVQQPHTAQ